MENSRVPLARGVHSALCVRKQAASEPEPFDPADRIGGTVRPPAPHLRSDRPRSHRFRLGLLNSPIMAEAHVCVGKWSQRGTLKKGAFYWTGQAGFEFMLMFPHRDLQACHSLGSKARRRLAFDVPEFETAMQLNFVGPPSCLVRAPRLGAYSIRGRGVVRGKGNVFPCWKGLGRAPGAKRAASRWLDG